MDPNGLEEQCRLEPPSGPANGSSQGRIVSLSKRSTRFNDISHYVFSNDRGSSLFKSKSPEKRLKSSNSSLECGRPLLDKSLEEAFNLNPHIRQIKQVGDASLRPVILRNNSSGSLPYFQYGNSVSLFSEDNLPRTLKDDDPRKPYQRRKDDDKTVLHWGQRKLLMSEIEFLTMYGKPGDVLVYAGAAPGNHTYFLSLMFPFIKKFILIDPSPFYCCSTDRVVVRQEFFTDDVAREFEEYGQQGNLLFVSDIRTACFEVMDDKEVEAAVKWDMEAQMRWHQIMKPRKSMLKFRLPWDHGTTDYLNGDVHLPVWGPITTTEGRLITTAGMKSWDNRKYEEQMFYFNVHTRTQLYDHVVKPGVVAGLDNCFDCASEVQIWKQYLTRYLLVWEHAKKKLMEIFKIRRKSDVPTGSDDVYFEEEGDIPTALGTLTSKPSALEESVMRRTDSWESDNTLWSSQTHNSDDLDVHILQEAIRLTNQMCSKGRTLVSNILPPGQRKWFQPRRFVNNEVVIAHDRDRRYRSPPRRNGSGSHSVRRNQSVYPDQRHIAELNTYADQEQVRFTHSLLHYHGQKKSRMRGQNRGSVVQRRKPQREEHYGPSSSDRRRSRSIDRNETYSGKRKRSRSTDRNETYSGKRKRSRSTDRNETYLGKRRRSRSNDWDDSYSRKRSWSRN